MRYKFFVDESGQSGIKNIRTNDSGGASPYMTLGGVLVPEAQLNEVSDVLEDLAKGFSKPDLHCSKLNHNQICALAREVSKLRILAFGVISLKSTLRGYRREIGYNDKHYYNKCAQYLLERLGLFMRRNCITEDDLSVVFEEGNFNYSALRTLISACRRNPIRPATKNLARVNPQSIMVRAKEDEPLLQLADLVAHSLYKLVDDSPRMYGLKETRYVDELRTRFFADKVTSKILGFGIYAVHNLEQIQPDLEVKQFLQNLNNS
ncbi:DUF3800 domain-containing protein [Pseudooceanicola batsensis]|uniref:DUF3800 domain-containing protein n=1 Tax=Pseudooceanicola batsensis TaxID=314255 RepID=UPI001EE67475|nr:DUF3800 domain-containing protein [Pseudooceanicola batsensis]